ncbi:MAG: hypothetical protein IKO19_12955 [Candidatus Riflebacteria bacterium]|nr:hypothetical protein [Candidatus Riflebacteria bacterium]
MIGKNGDIKFEWLMGLPFILIILLPVFACGSFYYNNFYSEINQKNIISSYNYILTRFRQDSHQAVVAITASDSLTLLDKNADQLCKYELNNNNLLRYDKSNKASVIFENIESLSFIVSEDQPNLLTVRIYPADKKELPFFTSFALRGLNNDMQ